MNILIDNQTEENIDNKYDEIMKKIIDCVVELEKIPQNIEVSITIVDNNQIKNLNNEYRNIDKITDVLSFPINDFEPLDENKFEYAEINQDTNDYILGDIIICYDRAKKQAEEYGHSINREMGFLTAHSILHLLGYDHMIKEEENIMFSKQKLVLDKVGLTR